MTTIQLGFKAFDPHELLCHFIAEHGGLYQRAKIKVELIDITFVSDLDLPQSVMQASCGAALAAALQGNRQRILFVACDRPMFWLYAKPGIESLAALANKKIATFPATAPPHHLANIILAEAGIDPATQVRLLPARDDVARLGLLRCGQVDAAVISSAMAPPEIERGGSRKLCFFGDRIRLPTTGLASHQSCIEQDPDLHSVLRDIMQQSLVIIHQQPQTVAAVLRQFFAVDAELALVTAELYQQYYTTDGTTSATIAQNAVAALCRSLSITPVPDWHEIYTCN